MHCLMVIVWCKFEQNWTKAIKVMEQKHYMLTEFRNDGHAENSIPPKTPFCGGYKNSVLQGGGGVCVYNYMKDILSTVLKL